MSRPDRFEVLTVGVEEELAVVDAARLELTGRAAEVLDALPAHVRPYVDHELKASQIETASPVAQDLPELASHLHELRSSVASTAGGLGCKLLATGSHPVSAWADQELAPRPSYAALQEEYQRLSDEQVVFGCHVHVGVEDPDLRIAALDRIRPWLAPLLALTANSPYWQGDDTGLASYRYVVFSRWPTFATPEPLGDWAGYRRVVDTLVDCGAIDSPKRLYWTVRPCERYPTLELRITDVCTTVDEAVMVAGLARALVSTALAETARGVPVPETGADALRMAEWQAARHGLRGPLLDPVTGRSRSAVQAVRDLLDHVGPALDAAGDGALVRTSVAKLLRHGNGADRQLAAHDGHPGMAAVLRGLVVEPRGTSAGRGPSDAGEVAPAVCGLEDEPIEEPAVGVLPRQ